ncbi:MAG TPA: rubrerythrin family protein [Candidatus Acidoferrales bacterium]|nr:rubrerythrin family protein [Candidatus Acidoferrales bacterium]
MRFKIGLGLLVVATVSFGIGRTTADGRSKLDPKTEENLQTAMHGEAFAYAKYMLYAKHARATHHPEIADLFESAAQTERLQHFAEEAELQGLVGSDAENLEGAIKGESYEVETMYLEFTHQAQMTGDKAAADRFEEIRHDEMGHRDAFKAALEKLNATSAAGD